MQERVVTGESSAQHTFKKLLVQSVAVSTLGT